MHGTLMHLFVKFEVSMTNGVAVVNINMNKM